MWTDDYFTRTVYSYRFPVVEEAIRGHYRKSNTIFERHEKAFTKKQDAYHAEFFNTYEEWVRPVVTGLSELTHSYPTAGSSEAIREVIHTLKAKHPTARIHVFEGEYEGYKKIAEAVGLETVQHSHLSYGRSLKETYQEHDVFFLSQPSSITGMLWDEYSAFMLYTEENRMSVAIDLAYVGCVAKAYSFSLEYSSVDYVFLSLSKSFGVYYLRIGGMYSRRPMPTLEGNKWFKNIDSLYIGQKLMSQFGVQDLPRQYSAQRHAALDRIAKTCTSIANDIVPADVFLLARIKDCPPGYRHLIRDKSAHARMCITPSLDAVITDTGFNARIKQFIRNVSRKLDRTLT